MDFSRPCLGDGTSEVTDFLIFSGARHFHSSPRWKVETVSPQSEVTHSQSLHDDDDADDIADDDDDVDDVKSFSVVAVVVILVGAGRS